MFNLPVIQTLSLSLFVSVSLCEAIFSSIYTAIDKIRPVYGTSRLRCNLQRVEVPLV